MDSEKPPIYYSVASKINSLQEKLFSFKFVKYPSSCSDSNKVIELLLECCTRLHNDLEELGQEWFHGRPKQRSHIESSMRDLGHSAIKLCPYLECLESSQYKRTRTEIIMPFRLLLNNILPESKKDYFLFHTRFDHQFEFKELEKDVVSILGLQGKEKKKFLKKYPVKYSLFSFPIIEKDNLFSLIILAHELAHYYDYFKEKAEISKSPKILKLLNPPRDKIKHWVETAVKFRKKDKAASVRSLKNYYLTIILNIVKEFSDIWLRELAADKIATRFLGIAYYLSVKEMFRILHIEQKVYPYPPNFRRLFEISKELIDPANGIEKDLVTRLKDEKKKYPEDFKILECIKLDLEKEQDEFRKLRSYKPPSLNSKLKLKDETKQEILSKLAFNIIEDTIKVALNRIDKTIKKRILIKRCNRITQDVFDAISYLKADIPPCEILKNRIFGKTRRFEMGTIEVAAWLTCYSRVKGLSQKKYYEDMEKVSRLSLRAIELSHFQSEFGSHKGSRKLYNENKKLVKKMGVKEIESGVLSKEEILYYMNLPLENALIITPLFHPDQIGESSLDVRLGNCFIVSKRASIENIDVKEKLKAKDKIKAYESQEKVQIEIDDSDGIVLHPGQFILGSTLEYIKLPLDIMAYVIGKSSVGRLGLVIATATHIDPGYKGTPTLELSNVGNVPLILHPRQKIAQLVFHKLSSPVKKGYVGEYSITTGPDYSKYLRPDQL